MWVSKNVKKTQKSKVQAELFFAKMGGEPSEKFGIELMLEVDYMLIVDGNRIWS